MEQVATAAGPGRNDMTPQGPALIEFFRHHGAWAPGVKLFRRLQFKAKAWTILAVLFVPVLLLGWNYFGDKSDAIGFTRKERLGVAYAREVLPLLQLASNGVRPQWRVRHLPAKRRRWPIVTGPS